MTMTDQAKQREYIERQIEQVGSQHKVLLVRFENWPSGQDPDGLEMLHTDIAVLTAQIRTLRSKLETFAAPVFSIRR